MKKTLSFYILGLLFASQTVFGQIAQLEIFSEQNIFLSHRYKKFKDPFPKNTSDWGARVNVYTVIPFNLWTAFTIIKNHGYTKEDGIEKWVNISNEFDADRYFVKDVSASNNNNINLRLSLGTFYEHNYKKWKLAYSIGLSSEFFHNIDLKYTIKEKGTNNIYSVFYSWSGNEEKIYEYGDETWMPSISAEVKVKYPIGKTSNLTLGLSFRQYLKRYGFIGKIKEYDSYWNDKEGEIKKWTHKGRLINSLGISVGFTFGKQ